MCCRDSLSVCPSVNGRTRSVDLRLSIGFPPGADSRTSGARRGDVYEGEGVDIDNLRTVAGSGRNHHRRLLRRVRTMLPRVTVAAMMLPVLAILMSWKANLPWED